MGSTATPWLCASNPHGERTRRETAALCRNFHVQIVPHMARNGRAGQNPEKQGKFHAKTRKDRPATGRPFLLGRIVPTEAKPSELSGEILWLSQRSVKAKSPGLQLYELSAVTKSPENPFSLSTFVFYSPPGCGNPAYLPQRKMLIHPAAPKIVHSDRQSLQAPATDHPALAYFPLMFSAMNSSS